MRKIDITIFISSPEDVKDERKAVLDVIAQLNKEFSNTINIRYFDWKCAPLIALKDFQEQIMTGLVLSDIVICILWKRIGTPNKHFGNQTGTQIEYQHAKLLCNIFNRPEILIHIKKAQVTFVPGNTEELLQYNKLLEFMGKEQIEQNGLQFYEISELKNKVTEQLRAKLKEILEVRNDGRVTNNAPLAGKRPFVGLESYKYTDTNVFFGRDDATLEIIQFVRRLFENGPQYLFVTGKSGCGKSSLVDAGIIPFLVQGKMSDKPLWKYARISINAAETEKGIFSDLADTILKVMDFGNDGINFLKKDSFQSMLSGNSPSAAKIIGDCLEKHEFYLVIHIDQFENLFISPHITPYIITRFVSAIVSLSTNDRILIISTIRNDYLHLLESYETQLHLTLNNRVYFLGAPSPKNILEIIRRPAGMVGIEYESINGVGLDDEIKDAAMRDPDSLPLLSFTLNELYNRNNEQLLTYEAYENIGRFEGSIAKVAEETHNSLSEDDENTFRFVFRKFVCIDGTLKTGIGKKPVAFSDFDANLNAKSLIEKFIESRLFSASWSSGGKSVEITHLALIDHWPRLKSLVDKDRDHLRVKTELDSLAIKWDESNRKRYLLDKIQLEQAKKLLKSGFQLDSKAADLVRTSKKKFIRINIFMALIACILIFATTLFYLQKNKADKETNKAKKATLESKLNYKKALENLSTAYAAMAEAENRQKHYDKAILYAAKSLGIYRNAQALSEYFFAYNSYPRALSKVIQPDMNIHDIPNIEWSPDGNKLAISVYDKIKIYDLNTDNITLSLNNPNDEGRAGFSWNPDGSSIAVGNKGKIELYDTSSGSVINELTTHGDNGHINNIVWSPSGKRIAACTSQNGTTERHESIIVWDMSPVHDYKVYKLNCGSLYWFMNEAYLIINYMMSVTARNQSGVYVINYETGYITEHYLDVEYIPSDDFSKFMLFSYGTRNDEYYWSDLKLTIEDDNGTIANVGINKERYEEGWAWSPDNKFIASVLSNGTVNIRDSRNGVIISELTNSCGSDWHYYVKWSPDGKKLLSTGECGKIFIWDKGGLNKNIYYRSFYGSDDWKNVVSSDKEKRIIAVRDENNSTRIYNTERKSLVATYKNKIAELSPTGKYAIIRKTGESCYEGIISIENNLIIIEFAEDSRKINGRCYNKYDWSLHDKYVYVHNQYDDRIYRILTKKSSIIFDRKGIESINHHHWSPDGRYFALEYQGTDEIFDTENGKVVFHHKNTWNGQGMTFNQIFNFTPNGKYFAIIENDEIMIFNTKSGILYKKFNKRGVKAHGLSWSPGGDEIAAGYSDGVISVWDFDKGIINYELKSDHKNGISEIAWAPDGKTIFSWAYNESRKIAWDINTKTQTHKYHNDHLQVLGISSWYDIIGGYLYNNETIFDAETLKEILKFRQPDRYNDIDDMYFSLLSAKTAIRYINPNEETYGLDIIDISFKDQTNDSLMKRAERLSGYFLDNYDFKPLWTRNTKHVN